MVRGVVVVEFENVGGSGEVGSAAGCGWGKRKVGRAIRVTPSREIAPPIFSWVVKGSLREGMSEQMSERTVGTRNVMTVASGSGRYDSESVYPGQPYPTPHPPLPGSIHTIQAKHANKPRCAPHSQQAPDTPLPQRHMRHVIPPHPRQAADARDAHAHKQDLQRMVFLAARERRREEAREHAHDAAKELRQRKEEQPAVVVQEGHCGGARWWWWWLRW